MKFIGRKIEMAKLDAEYKQPRAGGLFRLLVNE